MTISRHTQPARPQHQRIARTPDETLVHVKYDERSNEITQVHPVMIGRLPFAATAQGNEVLREATESYLGAAKSVTEQVHYPRKTPKPQAESYQWFVENERLRLNGRGWPLPHIRNDDQRLPYLDGEPGGSQGRRGRGTDTRQGPGRSASAGKRKRGRRPS